MKTALALVCSAAIAGLALSAAHAEDAMTPKDKPMHHGAMMHKSTMAKHKSMMHKDTMMKGEETPK